MVHPLDPQRVARLCVFFYKSGWWKGEEGELGPYLGVLAIELLTRRQAQISQWSLPFLSPFLLSQDWIPLLSVRIWLLSTRQLAPEFQVLRWVRGLYDFETHAQPIRLSPMQNLLL